MLNFKRPLWWIRWTQYEYWSWRTLYLPMLAVWLLLVIRTRRMAYFTAVNPGFAGSGFYGASKKAILDRIPAQYKPETLMITARNSPVQAVLEAQLEFPLIAKPDLGQRGQGVAKINDVGELMNYHHLADGSNYLIQTYIDYPIELGVLYSRLPSEPKGTISSVTLKEFLSVTGDGKSTLAELVHQKDRARFQAQQLQARFSEEWAQVVPLGKVCLLEPIGNHCRGTRFVKANELINPDLEAVFERIARQIDGFYYGRFDLRVRSLDDLYQGQYLKILELNGVSADPGHIYDAAHGLLNTYRDLWWHWNRVAAISQEQMNQGVKPLNLMQTFHITFQS
jgi:hypothetical protein